MRMFYTCETCGFYASTANGEKITYGCKHASVDGKSCLMVDVLTEKQMEEKNKQN